MPAATSSNNDVVSKNDESLAIVAAVASSSASDEGVRPPTSSVENQVDAVSIINDTLTYTQWRNLMLCFLAWACIVSNQTLVVGTSAVAILAIGGADNLATVPLGVFVYGSAFVSGTGLTSTVFSRYGRKVGFVMGIGMGLVGTVLACVSVVGASPALYIVANILYGMALGVGMHMRFAAVEIVPPSAAARAVTLVVSGGCIAAFAGPEAAAATQNWIADAPFLGTYIMTGIFYLLNLFFTILVDFTPPPPPPPAKRDAKLAETPSAVPAGDDDEDEASERADEYSRADLLQILLSRQFWIPTWTATVSWIGMALPMGLVRVAMSQVGYSSRDTLTTIELHFLGMFAPGFVVGRWIQQYGPAKVSIASVVVFGVAMALTLTCRAADDGTIATWILGIILVGFAWNLGFTAATVWLTSVYKDRPVYKLPIQAASDIAMFALSGAWILSSSYIFEAAGSNLDGWKVIQYVVLGFLGLQSIVLTGDWWCDCRGKQ